MTTVNIKLSVPQLSDGYVLQDRNNPEVFYDKFGRKGTPDLHTLGHYIYRNLDDANEHIVDNNLLHAVPVKVQQYIVITSE